MAEPSTIIRTGTRLSMEPTPGNGCRQDCHEHGQAVPDLAQNGHWMAVGRLTPGLIHEVNNALCAVGNYVQLLTLQGERQGWDILRPLAAMSNSLERAQAMTHRVAEYARGSARPGSRLRLNDLLGEALALASLQRTFRALRIHKAFADNLPEIEGDPKPLMDAFVELLSIAAHAVGRGGTLTVLTQSTPGWVMVTFNGPSYAWPCSETSLTLARQIIEQQAGRLVREAGPAQAAGDISVWLRASADSAAVQAA